MDKELEYAEPSDEGRKSITSNGSKKGKKVFTLGKQGLGSLIDKKKVRKSRASFTGTEPLDQSEGSMASIDDEQQQIKIGTKSFDFSLDDTIF